MYCPNSASAAPSTAASPVKGKTSSLWRTRQNAAMVDPWKAAATSHQLDACFYQLTVGFSILQSNTLLWCPSGASPALMSSSFPPIPFESPWAPLGPSLGGDVSLPCTVMSHNMSNSQARAPAATGALPGPGFLPPGTWPNSSVSTLFPNPCDGDCLPVLQPTALISLEYLSTVRAVFFVYCAQDKGDIVPLPPLFLF